MDIKYNKSTNYVLKELMYLHVNMVRIIWESDVKDLYQLWITLIYCVEKIYNSCQQEIGEISRKGINDK